MYHHDNRAYTVALKEAEEHLMKQIETKSHSAANVINRVLGTQLVDRVASTDKLHFTYTTEMVKEKVNDAIIERPNHTIVLGSKVHNHKNSFRERLHKHALGQAADRAGMPNTYVNRLLEKPYGAQLITENLNTIFAKESPQRYLLRSADEEIRGVLSDSYRRMDSRPILEAFAEAVNGLGAVPIEGIGGDLRFAVKALIPKVYVVGKSRPGNEEVFAFGVSLSNSDVGCGALSLQFFLWRIWCSNTATREDSLRRVHLGKRLGEDIEYSEETYAADTKTMALAVRDNVRNVLAQPKIEEALASIDKALDTTIEPKKFWERGGDLEKLKLSKAEIEKARETYNNGDVSILPRGDNVARMSQAIAWLAQTVPSAERRLELERVAGQLMEKAAA